MNRTLRTFVWLCILGMSGVFLANGATADGPQDPRLDKILADWQKRQNAVQSIDYQVEGEMKVPKGAYTQDRAALLQTKPSEIRVAPEEDLSGRIGLSLLLDFAEERFRLEKRDQSFHFNSCKLRPQVVTFTFDGKEIKSLSPREKNPGMGPNEPEMGIATGNLNNEYYLMDCYPIFFAHGRIYTPSERIVPGQMRNKPDPNYLHIHGTVIHEGRSCFIVRTQTFQLGGNIGFQEYWVDSERDSTIVRFGAHSGEKLRCDQDIVIHYKHLPDGWFPSGWRLTNFEHGKILYYQDMHVTKMKTNPVISETDFALESRPGMIVKEAKNHPSTDPFARIESDITVYRIEENGKRTYLPDPHHRPGDQYYKNQAAGYSLLPWFFLTTVTMLIALWIWVRFRSKKKRSLADPR